MSAHSIHEAYQSKEGQIMRNIVNGLVRELATSTGTTRQFLQRCMPRLVQMGLSREEVDLFVDLVSGRM